MVKITVTDRFTDPAGKPLRGQVVFTPSIRYIDVPDGATVPVHPVTTTLRVDGSISVALPATTGSDVNPTGWVWDVEEQLIGGKSADVYSIALPYDGPSTVVLRNLAPVESFTPVVYGPVDATDPSKADKPGSGLNGKPLKWNNTSGQLEDATSAVNSLIASAAPPKPGSGLNGKPVQWNNGTGQFEDATALINSLIASGASGSIDGGVVA
jgi:hypothetical protein